MKAAFAKSLVVLTGVTLVVPFVVVSLLVGAQASAAAAGAGQRLWLVSFALGGALLGGVKGLRGDGTNARLGHEPRDSRRAAETSPRLS